MIRVKKTRKVPVALAPANVKAAQQALQTRYDADPAACRAPRSRRLHVPAGLYNDATVKARLIADQAGKCCYCEASLLHVGYGDVEHYRPKNGFRQDTTTSLEKPGYYWLAYSWDNLLFACKRCNAGHKRSYFPLANHPAGYIGFKRAVAVAKTLRGQATIDFCGLNRKYTLERRRTHLAHVESHDSLADLDLATILPADLARQLAKCGSAPALAKRIRQARAIYQAAALAEAEFAGMVRANFPHLPVV